MTALVSLATRLSLAKVALHVHADRADVEALAPVLAAGVDLLLLGGSGDVKDDVETLRTFRRRFAHTRLLLGTDDEDVAEPAAADVVHFRRRHWVRAHTKGHEWGLRGVDVLHESALESPGEDFDYLFVGSAIGLPGDLLAAAVALQPPLTAGAVPWFAVATPFTGEVAGCLAAGARRIALTDEIVQRDDAADVVGSIAEAVSRAWADDERTPDYRRGALRA
ncbi:hypothetical protein [Tessaracoccus antarcticus]|uniref:Thiamine-phosphate pyrophosphorylase n=1 Tax=Tessaracoccus antarcticus TaxID=2479848 RepID=A0A3M0GAZ8_9ACTN|nr:hypothetical protein [Tessaracoccus antarcticus]RMB59662.1 hypothetical protein EAX62_07810 [Tessaracoccus antarcticus]